MTNALTETFWDRLDSVQAAMLDAGGGRFVPMAPYADAEAGAIWFITADGTDVAKTAASGGIGKMMIADASANLYADLEGRMHIVDNPEKLSELWSMAASAWFEEGRDDPDIRLVKLTPTTAEIWATDGAAGFVFEIAKAKIADTQPDMGTHGVVNFRAAA
ncbi:pyridoxamine 5'-phosphate oxidase family protein [Cognatishimia sp. F0-27]|uniref:pyridoxamine 5'-phosphate oxidase family protein n=1 Tax=Cognatishimia sp. F0-27 TaxID=2816855 RepID=UPI001D0C5644|nr:pyridoxamine 5'-phosphate oxidase family protein [Cognatishimia sp. F0-27]MCC1492285.1 pyridoxamine 5'-phosphate oxidase family protein [Cognatishimia sp. F0-27]